MKQSLSLIVSVTYVAYSTEVSGSLIIRDVAGDPTIAICNYNVPCTKLGLTSLVCQKAIDDACQLLTKIIPDRGQHVVSTGDWSSMIGDPALNDCGATVILPGNLTIYSSFEQCQKGFQAIQDCGLSTSPDFVPSGCVSGRINYHHCGEGQGSLLDYQSPGYYLGPSGCGTYQEPISLCC